jgi:hypothetical protein
LLALLFAAGAVLALFAIVARAQDWPSHPRDRVEKQGSRAMSMVSTQEDAAPPALQFVALTKHIGCEVKGIDLRKPVPPAAASAIYRVWLDHAVPCSAARS